MTDIKIIFKMCTLIFIVSIILTSSILALNKQNKVFNNSIQINYIFDPNDTKYDSTIIANMEEHKKLNYNLPNEPSYILRLDDVQSPMWSDISIQIINDTLSKNMSIVIGIIPDKNYYETTNLKPYINKHKNNSHLEIAQHGLNHTLYEYGDLTPTEVQNKTMKGLRILYHDYGIVPITFIPPNNNIDSENNSTPNTLNNLGFKILSSEGDMEYKGNILDVSANAYTINRTTLIEPKQIINVCNHNFKTQNLSVIMIHPQDYSDQNGKLDPEKYKLYLELLNELNNTKAQSITFKDLII